MTRRTSGSANRPPCPGQGLKPVKHRERGPRPRTPAIRAGPREGGAAGPGGAERSGGAGAAVAERGAAEAVTLPQSARGAAPGRARHAARPQVCLSVRAGPRGGRAAALCPGRGTRSPAGRGRGWRCGGRGALCRSLGRGVSVRARPGARGGCRDLPARPGAAPGHPRCALLLPPLPSPCSPDGFHSFQSHLFPPSQGLG